MHFGDLEIPDDLLKAQDENSLVVFAGAGVSKAAGLPLFKKLVDDTEKHFLGRISGPVDEPLEKRLSLLVEKGYAVHEYIHSVFAKYSSHGELHSKSLRLFKKSQSVKIVTTNFDILFENAVSDLRPVNVRSFSSPALPRGDRFNGIVHVHGSIHGDPQDLVLTDQDLGRAYLTEGWARRFILDLFLSHHVLFLGYSHGEDVLRHLARALPPTSKRYVFSSEDEKHNWQNIGVQTISCESSNYDQQLECLSKWGEWTQRTFTWIEQKIDGFVKKEPPTDKAEVDIIKRSLAELESARCFVVHARTPQWLLWTNEQNSLQNLFEHRCKLSKIENLLSGWIADNYATQHPELVLHMIASHGGTMNPSFWTALVRAVTFGENAPKGDRLLAWLSVLLPQSPDITGQSFILEHLLSRCSWRDEKSIIVTLLEYFLRPIPKPAASLGVLAAGESERLSFEVGTKGDSHWLSDVWTRLSSEVSVYWMDMLPIVQSHLVSAFRINCSFDRAGGDEDPTSFLRSAIEPHEQDLRNKRNSDILINIARDILEFLLSDPDLKHVGKYLIDLWYSTEVPLLRRIAIHGIGYGDCWTPNEKIEWLLQHDLIYRHWYKHEVFQVLKKSLGTASEETIAQFMTVVDVDRTHLEESEQGKVTREYEKYNLLGWMHESAPANASIKEAFEVIQNAHPTWSTREHPDLDHWSGGAQLVVPESPVTGDQLKGMPVSDAVSLLLTFKPKDPQDWRDERRGLLERLQGLATSDFDWSMSIADRVADSPDSKEDIWYHLIKGWEKASLSDDDILKVLSFMSEHPRSIGTHTAVAEYMEALVRSEKTTNERVLVLIESLSDQVWEMLNDPNEESKFWSGSWLTTALNHWSGHTAETWLHTLDRRKKLAGDGWTGLPDPYKARFTKLLDSNSFAAQLARCVIVSRLHYLQYLDSEWTREHLLPLLDFGRDKLTAEQSWHGYLFWGQLTRDQVAEMKPAAVSAALGLEDGGENFRKLLFERITDMMIIDPSEEPDWVWFYSILSNGVVTSMELGTIAKRIEQTLREADDEFTDRLWTRWLKQYWSDRIDGKPVPMSPQEGDNMLVWPLYLGEFFTEAAGMARRISVFELRFTHLFGDLQDSKLVEEYPQEVARWVTHTLQPQKDYEQHSFYLVPLYQKLKEILGAEAIVELTEELVRLGFVSAVD